VPTSRQTFANAPSDSRVTWLPFCRVLSKESGAARQIAGQLLRAGTSVGANVEETRYWLRLIAETKLATTESVEPLLQEANELVAIFAATVCRARLPRDS